MILFKGTRSFRIHTSVIKKATPTCDNPPPLFLIVICLEHILVPVLLDAVSFDTLPRHGPREGVMVRDNIRKYMSARMKECSCMLMCVCVCLSVFVFACVSIEEATHSVHDLSYIARVIIN